MRLPRFLQTARESIQVIREHGPAAGSNVEVALSYPGIHAIWGYRLVHVMWKKSPKFRVPAWLVSQMAYASTGTEVHLGATVGRRFPIGHGMGVVIGETAEVGDDCMLCHDVALGGTALVDKKRHPTLGDGIVIGVEVKILGPVTVGNGSHVGTNAIVIKDVPDDSTTVGVPATSRSRKREDALYINLAI